MTAEEHPEPDRPVVAGRYELGPVLGSGSSAVVRRARDLRSGLAVAFKHFHPGGSAHDRRQQRQEMEALARLDHPGLVGLHDGGTEDGRHFVVTDLVEGPTLAERLAAGPPMEPGAVRRLGAQLAAALAHVHATGLVHRDVKPANVLLDDGARPRLADFGISRTIDATAATATGCVVGTAAYLAPEQARGQRVGPAADVYSLGLVLLEALTGRREYPGLPIESATARLFRSPAVPAELPAGLTPLLQSMTADDPQDRPTAAAVATALSAPPAVPAPAQRGRHHQRRSAAVLLAAAALVVAAVIGGVVLLAGRAAPVEAPRESASLPSGARLVDPPSTPGARLAPLAPELVAVEQSPRGRTPADEDSRPAEPATASGAPAGGLAEDAVVTTEQPESGAAEPAAEAAADQSTTDGDNSAAVAENAATENIEAGADGNGADENGDRGDRGRGPGESAGGEGNGDRSGNGDGPGNGADAGNGNGRAGGEGGGDGGERSSAAANPGPPGGGLGS